MLLAAPKTQLLHLLHLAREGNLKLNYDFTRQNKELALLSSAYSCRVSFEPSGVGQKDVTVAEVTALHVRNEGYVDRFIRFFFLSHEWVLLVSCYVILVDAGAQVLSSFPLLS